MKHKMIAGLSVLLCGLGLAGCAAATASQKTRTIDLIVKSTQMEFWRSVDDGAQAAAAAYGITVTLYGPEKEIDYRQQVNYMKGSIARKPDAIILAAADYTLLAQPVQEAIDAGIPVVMVDSDVDNTQTVAYVGTDNVALGTQLAKQLSQRTQAAGEVGIVSFVQQSYPAVQREQGFRSVMADRTRFTLLDTIYCDSDVDRAAQETKELVAAHPRLVALAALNAESAEGAARALAELDRGDIALYAIDCMPAEAMYMEDGILRSALLQNPYQMGYYSVETAVRFLQGETVEDFNTDIYPVDAATMFDDFYQQLIFPFDS